MIEKQGEKLTLTVEETARVLSISRGLAYEMVRQGKIPALHFNRCIRIPRHALYELLGAKHDGEKSEEV